MEKSLPDFNLNGTNLIHVVWRRKIVFILIGIVAFAVSLIVSLLMGVQYKSTAILIPAVSTQASKDVIVPTRPKGFAMFGDDEEVEHLLQILSSETLRKVIVKKHDLFSHYGINPNDKHAWHKVNGTYASNISFMPSRYRSVRIQVLDGTPDVAAKLANSIVVVADSLTRKAKRDVALKALSLLEDQYQFALAESKRIEDSLNAVGMRGVLDLPNQAKEFTAVYAAAIKSGDNTAANRIRKEMDILAGAGGTFTRYFNESYFSANQLKEIKENLQILRIEAAGEIPSQFVVDWAIPADKKARPKRSVIVIVSTLAALFFTLFLLIIIEFIRKSINPAQGED